MRVRTDYHMPANVQSILFVYSAQQRYGEGTLNIPVLQMRDWGLKSSAFKHIASKLWGRILTEAKYHSV